MSGDSTAPLSEAELREWRLKREAMNGGKLSPMEARLLATIAHHAARMTEVTAERDSQQRCAIRAMEERDTWQRAARAFATEIAISAGLTELPDDPFAITQAVRTIKVERDTAFAASATQAAEIARLREALAEEQAWHERQDKVLSKSGRQDSEAHWQRGQHQERALKIEADLSAAPLSPPVVTAAQRDAAVAEEREAFEHLCEEAELQSALGNECADKETAWEEATHFIRDAIRAHAASASEATGGDGQEIKP